MLGFGTVAGAAVLGAYDLGLGLGRARDGVDEGEPVGANEDVALLGHDGEAGPVRGVGFGLFAVPLPVADGAADVAAVVVEGVGFPGGPARHLLGVLLLDRAQVEALAHG